jgi:hypothetical protein
LSIRTARLAGIGVVSLIVAVGAAYVLLPIVAWGFVRALSLTLNGSVWLAAAIGSGADAWTIVRTIANAAAGTLTTPQASGAIALLVVVGALALYGLQRLLGSQEDSSR